jgi:hypothetical protein
MIKVKSITRQALFLFGYRSAHGFPLSVTTSSFVSSTHNFRRRICGNVGKGEAFSIFPQ